MNTSELKLQLISSISRINNKEILEEVYHLIHLEDEDYQTVDISEKQKRAITKAIEQIERGQYLTNDQVEEYFSEWLKD
ncbi:MAG: hypothetical protein EPN39_09900 [Chitinophagaceae bacterium]|jgi:hypothetical protein|nr:MAG: hypothetical protein EPN39_09900 [Chitinophagaceae bacterium]